MVQERFKSRLSALVNAYSDRFLSKWIILLYDIVAVGVAFVFAYIVRHNFIYKTIDPNMLEIQTLLVVGVYTTFFLITHSFSGIVRHTSWNDTFRIFRAGILSFTVIFLLTFYVQYTGRVQILRIPYSIVLSHFLLTLLILVMTRVIVKSIFRKYLQTHEGKKVHVLIYGAGSAGILTRDALMKDALIAYDIVAFVDDNPTKNKKRLFDIPVLPNHVALSEKYIKKHDIRQLIIAIAEFDIKWKQEIVEKALQLNVQVKSVPPIENWINGELHSRQVKQIRIEELLEREPIRLDNQHLKGELQGKRVLVTGAAGSIGSEIVRQVISYNPQQVILLDQAESALYDLQFELNSQEKFRGSKHLAEYVIADVKDRFRMDKIFKKYHPDIVYHAAAYKHVPLMEQNPYEAIMVNVFGTKNIADLSIKYKAAKFIMISTDKAVNPTNIMGASKRIAEIITQSRQNGGTQFITTRFGNVMGSNGSVIPLFRKQIEYGGPITVTHKDIIRYFMTIPEACNLVLEAGAMGKGGEIFVFDMGQPVKIYDMAKKMVQLYGLTLGVDINIIETGLRPGEKLFEELLSDNEKTKATHHPKIMIANINGYRPDEVDKLIIALSESIVESDEFDLVATMKRFVPEFVSNNSVFEKLDKK